MRESIDAQLEPGKYVVAVSGGVDSVVLLDVLRNLPQVDVVVAHYDHGIRPDSTADRKFVERLAKDYGVDFYFEEGNLGASASEELARTKRYEFLNKIVKKVSADAVVTAHHKDDRIETAIINILRGTGRKGVASLASRPGLIRPFLNNSKVQLIEYAQLSHLKWCEDESNKDEKYLRNYVRARIVPNLKSDQLDQLDAVVDQGRILNDDIDQLLDSIADILIEDNQIKQSTFNMLSHDVAKEFIAHVLRKKRIEFSRETLERLVVFAKTASPGKTADITNGWKLIADTDTFRLNNSQSV